MHKARFRKATGEGKYASQSGNVLFLILIAVALFAALSYAVTSSTQTTGNNEQGNLIGSAQITQYPTSIINGLVSMIISGSSIDEIRFNRPSNDEFDDLDSVDIGVFHPQGGGISYVQAPDKVMANNKPGDWVFNAEMEVPDIGLNGVGGNDVIAYLVGIKKAICLKINEEHGIGATIPELESSHSAEYETRMYDDGSNDYDMPYEDVPDIDDGAGTFDGQPFGCFQDGGGGDYVYYHVILER